GVAQLLRAGMDALRDLGDVLGPLLAAEPGEGSVQRRARGLDGPVDVALGRLRGAGDDLLGGRADDLDRRRAGRRHPLAADVEGVLDLHEASCARTRT